MLGARVYGSICRALVVSKSIEFVSPCETVLGKAESSFESKA